MSFPFPDKPNTSALVCRHVLCEKQPILRGDVALTRTDYNYVF